MDFPLRTVLCTSVLISHIRFGRAWAPTATSTPYGAMYSNLKMVCGSLHETSILCTTERPPCAKRCYQTDDELPLVYPLERQHSPRTMGATLQGDMNSGLRNIHCSARFRDCAIWALGTASAPNSTYNAPAPHASLEQTQCIGGKQRVVGHTRRRRPYRYKSITRRNMPDPVSAANTSCPTPW